MFILGAVAGIAATVGGWFAWDKFLKKIKISIKLDKK